MQTIPPSPARAAPRAKWEVNCGVVTKIIRIFTGIAYLCEGSGVV